MHPTRSWRYGVERSGARQDAAAQQYPAAGLHIGQRILRYIEDLVLLPDERAVAEAEARAQRQEEVDRQERREYLKRLDAEFISNTEQL